MKHLPLFLASLLLPLAACSGGGSSAPAAGGANTLEILVQTDAGSDVTLTAVVDAVSLERPDGSLTGDLLGGSRELVLSDPAGRPALLRLHGVPAGPYRSVHLLVMPGNLTARMPDGTRETVHMPSQDLEIGTAQPVVVFEPRPGGDPWRIAHEARLELRRNNRGVPNWTPQMSLRRGVSLPLRHTHVRVQGTDPRALTMNALLEPFGGTLQVRLVFGRDAVILDKDARELLSRQELFRRVNAGTRLTVEGMMSPQRELDVTYCEWRSREPEPSENEVLGRITSVDAAAETFVMQVLSLQQGNAFALVQNLPTVIVDASNARIGLEGLPGGRGLPFSALAVGTLVEVEWTRASGRILIAEDIEIVRDPAGGFGQTRGLVDEVRLRERVILVVPNGNRPLHVAGVPVNRARVLLPPGAVLVRQQPWNTIDLQDVQIGERIRLIGRATGGTDVEALWVRVR